MNLLEIHQINNSILISAAEIIRIEASSNYSYIYFANGEKLMVTKVLNWFEQRLPLDLFVRVHRSHLVNINFIQKVYGSTQKSLRLHNGEIITVSRRKKKSLILSL